jgi:hypothetical protein
LLSADPGIMKQEYSCMLVCIIPPLIITNN